MTDPCVFVVILNYRNTEYVKNCLSSLETQTYANFKTIVYDNASSDHTAYFIKQFFPEVILLRNERNLGFAKANNLAIKFALDKGADYILLLNNDTITDSGLIEQLVQTLDSDNTLGIAGPIVFDMNNKSVIQEFGMSCDRFGCPMPSNNQIVADHKKISEVFYVSGCALMMKKEVLVKIGLFDDKYFMFAEDLDLCWRAQLAGYRVVVDKEAKIYHASGGSILGGVFKSGTYKTNTKRIFLRERNTLRTVIKNYSRASLVRMIPFYLFFLCFECIVWALLMKPNVCISLLNALVWNIRVLPDTLFQRGRIQQLRVETDKVITQRMKLSCGKFQIFRLVGIPRLLKSN